MKTILKYLLAAGLPLTVAAQDVATQPETEPVATEHQWLYGVGHINVLDTYLSPLTYSGPSFTVLHRSERLAHWGGQRVTVQGIFDGHAAYIATAADDDKAWDGHLSASVAWHYNWRPNPRLRLGAGGFAQFAAGFTYLLKGGNNPAQGRCHLDFGFSGLAERQFSLWHHPFLLRAQFDLPLLGAMFSPNYGQSYYEIFSLGHYDKNIRCTHPFNAPSARWEAGLCFPLRKSLLTLGYLGDIRQSHVNRLKHHSWNHSFMLGYVRHLQLVKPKRNL